MSLADPAARRDPLWAPWAVAGCLLLAIAIIYGQTRSFHFLNYDDNIFVYGRPEVRDGLTRSGIAWAFSNGPVGEWYPLAMMSHMLDCQLFGLGAGGHHLTSVLLHAATAIGLFLVLRSMTGAIGPALTATLFAIHPQHVESVAWIAERRDVLSGLFFVLTLAAYLGYVRHGRSIGRYLLVALLLALGLMSKSMLVTLPPLLLLLDYWPLGRFGAADPPPGAVAIPRERFRRLVVEKLPLLALALGDAAITLATHIRGPIAPPPFSARFSNALVSLVKYLVQFLYPVGLAAFYPFPATEYPAWQVVGAILLLASITAMAVVWRRKCPYLVVGWFWFLGMMAPVLGLFQIAKHAMGDRYMYLPSIGLSIAIVWGTAALAERLGWVRPARWAATAVVVAVLIGLSVRQTAFWHDDLALWEHTLPLTEDNRTAEEALAFALANAGRLDEAVERYCRAAEWFADARLLNSLGSVLFKQDRTEQAAAEFRQAIELDPAYAEPEANLGYLLAGEGRLDEAAEHYARAIQLDSRYLMPRFNLANLLLRQGRPDEAIVHLERVIELDPEQVMPHLGLAAIFAERGDFEKAIAHYRAALKIAPDDPVLRQGLQQLLDAQRRANSS